MTSRNRATEVNESGYLFLMLDGQISGWKITSGSQLTPGALDTFPL